jgi:hypothetical protein
MVHERQSGSCFRFVSVGLRESRHRRLCGAGIDRVEDLFSDARGNVRALENIGESGRDLPQVDDHADLSKLPRKGADHLEQLDS